MTLIRCPDCDREISDRATACPGCSGPLRERDPAMDASGNWAGRSLSFYEYKSQTTLFGLPLIHIFLAPTWLVGFRPARAIIAVGNIAIGFAAFGGISLGLVRVGGIALAWARAGSPRAIGSGRHCDRHLCARRTRGRRSHAVRTIPACSAYLAPCSAEGPTSVVDSSFRV